MINELIVALANKTVGFSIQELNVQQAFRKVSNTSANAIRALLLCNNTYGALAVAQLMKQTPYVSLLLPKDTTSTDLSKTTNTSRFSIKEATLIAGADGAVVVRPSSIQSTKDLTADITITYNTDTTIKITIPGDVLYADVAIVGNRVCVKWPKALNIRGDLLLDAPYSKTTEVHLTIPVIYPCSAVITSVEQTREYIYLLEPVDLMESYHLADSDHEKVAILGLALYRTFKKYE